MEETLENFIKEQRVYERVSQLRDIIAVIEILRVNQLEHTDKKI